AAAIVAAAPSGPTLRVVQNRSRRFCRTHLFMFEGSNPASCVVTSGPRWVNFFASTNWRRERDSNPRRAFDPYTLSMGAPSTTRPSLRFKPKALYFQLLESARRVLGRICAGGHDT